MRRAQGEIFYATASNTQTYEAVPTKRPMLRLNRHDIHFIGIFLGVVSDVGARRILAQWREQYGLVRERLAPESNAVIASLTASKNGGYALI